MRIEYCTRVAVRIGAENRLAASADGGALSSSSSRRGEGSIVHTCPPGWAMHT